MAIRILARLIFAVPFLFFAKSPAVCADWAQVQEAAAQRAVQAEKDAAQTLAVISEQRKPLLAELARLEEQVKQQEARFQELAGQFEAGAQRERDMQTRLRQEQEDAERVTEVFLEARKDAGAMLKSSLFAAVNPATWIETDAAKDFKSGPGFADVQRLADALFAEMERSGTIERREGTFIGSGGTEVKGDMLMLGNFNGFYRQLGEVGFLRNDRSSGRLVAVPVSSSWFDGKGRKIANYFAGKGDILPIDLSKGEVLGEFNHKDDLFTYLRSGGLLVWPILLVGLVAFVLIIERVIFLMRTEADSEKLMGRIQELTACGQWQECRQYCADYARSSVCRVLRAGLNSLGDNREILENALQEAIMKELPRLERFLSTISVLAAVAPLLGLLGTVSGMINTFHAITLHGTGDPRMLSSGISEALITTELGLMVAVPVLLLHHFLERRVDVIVGEMEEKSTALTVIVLKNRGAHAGLVHQVA